MKMTSQLVIFELFVLWFRPPTLNLKKIPVNQLIKQFMPNGLFHKAIYDKVMTVHKFEPLRVISNNVAF